jgi:hypothetical protein
MTSAINPAGQKNKKMQVNVQGGPSDVVYGLGLIGASVYYIGRATTPQQRIQGFFKGLLWPAFLVHALLNFLDNE